MSLRSMVCAIAALAILVVCAPVARAADTIELSYANFPPPITFPCVQMEKWKEEVEKRTDGKVSVQTFPGGSLLKAKAIMDGVLDGTADIGCLAFPYQPGRFPLLAGVDLPVGFPKTRTS